MIGHENLSAYAEDKAALYKLWNDDLKKTMRRRQVHEAVGIVFLCASYLLWKNGYGDVSPACFLFGFGMLFTAIKIMVDESNINYLMHQWDLQDAIKGFSDTE